MCDDNWKIILSEHEHLFDSIYQRDGVLYKFFGLIHASDDYYYGMVNINTGVLSLSSCVGSIEGHDFVKVRGKS